jgi:hypothetical protein
MRGFLPLLAGLAAVSGQNTLPSELKFEFTDTLYVNDPQALILSELKLYDASGTTLSIGNIENPNGRSPNNNQKVDKLKDGLIAGNSKFVDLDFPANSKSTVVTLEPPSGIEVASCKHEICLHPPGDTLGSCLRPATRPTPKPRSPLGSALASSVPSPPTRTRAHALSPLPPFLNM